MVSLRGQFINWYFTRIGFKNGMAKDIARGNHRASEPPAKIMSQNTAAYENFKGRKVWTLHPKGGVTSDPKTRVMFFHGGAYFYDIIKEHWGPWARIANLSGAPVVLPSYPLIPEASATEIADWALACFLDYRMRYPDTKIILGGDSAGGGLALQVCQRLAAERNAMPEHLLLWSPWADVSRDNPALIEQDKRSVIIGLDGSQTAAAVYQGEMDPTDPRISPIYGDLSCLPPTTIVTGSRDLLYPDILRLYEAMETAGETPDLQIWPGQNHYFMYLPQPEAGKVGRQTAALIRSV